MKTSASQSSENSWGHLGLMAAYFIIITLTVPFSFLMSDALWSRWFYEVRQTCKVDAFMVRAMNRKKAC